MARIQDKSKYPLDTNVTKDDYLVGSDADQGFRTVNFNIGSILRLINSEINFVSTEYRFSDETDPELTKSTTGIFSTNGGQSDPSVVTKLYINKLNIGGTDLSDMFTLMVNNVYTFSLKLVNSGDPADVFYFKVNTAVDQGDHFELDVNVIGGGYTRELVNLTTFNIFMEVVGTQNNKNLVKYTSVTGEITDAKAVSSINNLTQFVLSEEQNLYIQVSSDNGSQVTYILKDKGKGLYGNGGTPVVEADLQSISSGDSTLSQSVNKQSVVYTGSNSNSKVVAAVNSLPSYEVTSNTLVVVEGTSSEHPEKYTYILKGITPGTYGINETQITEDNLELIAIFGGDQINLVKDLSIAGEPTEANVATAINNLSSFYVGPSQNIYYRVTKEGTTTQYTFVADNLGSGTYGYEGRSLSSADLKLIGVNSGGTSWNLKVGGIQKKAVKGGDTIDFKGNKYAVVKYTAEGVVEVSTSQELDDLLSKFKPVYSISKEDHQALVDAGNEEDAVYLIPCNNA